MANDLEIMALGGVFRVWPDVRGAVEMCGSLTQKNTHRRASTCMS
jgi:hypothetical protein